MMAGEEAERAVVFPLFLGPPKRMGETGRTGTAALCRGAWASCFGEGLISSESLALRRWGRAWLSSEVSAKAFGGRTRAS